MYANRPKPGTKAWMSYIRTLRTKKNGGSSHKRRKTARRNMYTAGAVANPRPRTRTVTRYVKARRNGPRTHAMLAGFGIPGIEPIAGVFAGLAVPPVLDYFLAGFVPASITSKPIGRYALSAAEVILPAYLVRRFINKNVGNSMMVVGLGKLLFDAVKAFAPGIPGLSGGLGFQPMLGVYPGQRRGLPAARQVPMMTSQMNSGVPDRLDANSRF